MAKDTADTLTNTFLSIVCGLALIGFGAALASAPALPDLPKDFRQAASVGQLTQKQAAKACFDAQDGVNAKVKSARGDNKFAPAQGIDFHCVQATVNTEPAPATLTPAP